MEKSVGSSKDKDSIPSNESSECKDSMPLQEIRDNIVEKIEPWDSVNQEVAEEIKSLINCLKQLAPDLEMTAFFEHPISVSSIRAEENDGQNTTIAVGHGTHADQATAKAAKVALKTLKREMKEGKQPEN